jgi:hypothetical protein
VPGDVLGDAVARLMTTALEIRPGRRTDRAGIELGEAAALTRAGAGDFQRITGKDGDDAKLYIEKEVNEKLAKLKDHTEAVIETRGIGGVFYDHLDEKVGLSKTELLQFALELGRKFPFIYEEQAQYGRDQQVTSEQLAWRNLRRGRYVEFNLVNDRGTKFGLLSGGRTESILMSLPPMANWEYNLKIEPDSLESNTLDYLKTLQNWLG